MEINRYLINPMKLDQLSRALICGTSLLGLAGPSAFGQTNARWNGGANNQNWGHGNNWSPSGVPSSTAYRAQFDGNNGADTYAQLNGSWTIGQFQVITPATLVTLRSTNAANVLTVTPTAGWAAGVGVDMSGATKDFTFNGTTGTAWTYKLGSSQSWNVTSASANGNLISNSGVTVDLQAHTLTANAGTGRTISIAGPITGTGGGVTKTGVGILAVNGASNTYSGNTTISNGTLRAGVANALPFGAGKGNVVIDGGASAAGTFDINGFDVAINGLSGTSDTVLGKVQNNVAGTKALTVGNNDATASFAGVIGGGTGVVALTKTGSGTQTLSGANTYFGATTVNGGALKVDGSTSTSSAVAVNNAAVLRGTGTVGGAVTLNGTSSMSSTGALALTNGFTAAGSTNSITGGTISGNGTINSGTTLNLASGSTVNGSVAVNGSLSGTGTVGGALTGNGTVDAGNSPGILTVSTVNSQNLGFNFEFTSTGIPNYGNADASVNDVLRLTSATPFTVDLASTNLVNIYLNVGVLNAGDVFNGGFYTDNNADFLSNIQNASFIYYLANGSGSTSYNGGTYDLYTGPLTFDVATVAEAANFGAGNVNGYVSQFTVVPEPSAFALLAGGMCALAFRRRRA